MNLDEKMSEDNVKSWIPNEYVPPKGYPSVRGIREQELYHEKFMVALDCGCFTIDEVRVYFDLPPHPDANYGKEIATRAEHSLKAMGLWTEEKTDVPIIKDN